MHLRGRSIQVVSEFKNLGELSDTVKQFSYRVLKEDCLDLPPKNFIKRHITLTPEQQKVYKQMKDHALAMLNGKVTTTMTVLTQLMRLHQITCGHFTADDGSVQSVKSNRMNELMSILEDMDGKAIIWANYQRDIENIVDEITDKYGPAKCRFLVGTPQTGGYGITLTQANTVIYYSNGYDLEKRLQSEDRAHRIGQKKTVTYIDLICEDTVDEKIVKALRDKINIASEVMGEELKDWI
jgi:SNF2 family DNA or RNA helicase